MSYEASIRFDKFRQVHLHASDWQQESLTFVPLRGTWFAQSEHSFYLEEEITKFLSGDKKVLLLLGDSGSGKSLYTQGLASKLWQDHKPDTPIPVWISLPSLKNPVNRAIEETFEKFGLNAEQITSLKQTHSFIFILDAFDEIHQLKNLWVSNHLDQWKAKIIITCRREYLYHVDNYKLYFTPFNGEKAVYQDYDEMIIKPFSEEQIEKYVKQYIQHQKPEWTEVEKYQNAIEEMPGLKNLIKTPFLLKLAMEALPKMPQDKEQKYITQAKLYDVFIEQWFSRQEQKLKLAKKIKEEEDIKPEFWDYAKRLAQLMHQQKITQVTYDSSHVSDLFGETEDNPWQKFFNPENPRTELLQTACLVREVGQHQYAFIHHSLLQYFFTRDLYENLLSKQQELKIIQETPQISQPEHENKDYFNERLLVEEANIIQLLADRVEEDELFKKTMFDRVYESKTNPQVAVGSSNAITVLNRARVSFSGLDLSGIRIPHADLGYALLHNTIFSRADLQGVSLQQAHMSGSVFSHSNMKDIDFGQLPYYETNVRITYICCSPNGHYIAMICGKLIIILDKQLRVYCKIEGDAELVKSIAFNSSSTLLVSGGRDASIKLWDIMNLTQKGQNMYHHTGWIYKVAFSQDDKLITSVSQDGTICFWDTSSQVLLEYYQPLDGSDPLKVCEFSPDNSLLAISSLDYGIFLWSVESKRLLTILKGNNKKTIWAMAFNHNSKLFACGGEDKILWLWNIESFEFIALEGHYDYIVDIAFDHTGNLLVSVGWDRTVLLWDVKNRKLIGSPLVGHEGDIMAIAFNNESSMLLSGGEDGKLRFWSIANQKAQNITNENHPHKVRNVQVSPDGNLIVSRTDDNLIYLWSLKHQKLIGQLSAKKTSCYAFNYNGSLLACGNKDGDIYFWDVKSRTIVEKSEGGQIHYISHISFKAGEKILLIGAGDKIKLYDYENRKFLDSTLDLDVNNFSEIEFDIDGKFAATQVYDRNLYLWDLTTNQKIGQLSNEIKSFSFSLERKLIACGLKDGTIQIWNIETQQIVSKFVNKNSNYVPIVVFSTDGKLLASNSDNKILVWTVANQQCLQVCVFSQRVESLTFSRDNNYLIAGIGNSIATLQKQKDKVNGDNRYVLIGYMGTLSLRAEELVLDNVQNLSVANLHLLTQLGANSNLQENEIESARLTQISGLFVSNVELLFQVENKSIPDQRTIRKEENQNAPVIKAFSDVKKPIDRVIVKNQFTIPCTPTDQDFTANIGEPSDDYHPLAMQLHWLKHIRGNFIADDAIDAMKKLYALAKKNNVNFVELCAYALKDEEKPDMQKMKNQEDITKVVYENDLNTFYQELLKNANVEPRSANSYYVLGQLTKKGWGIDKDEEKAKEYFKAAFELGSVEALFSLSESEAENESNIMGLLNLAEQGNPESWHSLAIKFDTNEFVRRILINAEKIAKTHSDDNDAKAQNRLGFLSIFFNVEDLPVVYEEAHQLFQKASKQDFAAAFYNLALLGRLNIIQMPIEKIMSYLISAADRGNAVAQFEIGRRYFQGDVLPKNYQVGFFYMNKAVLQGYTFAKSWLTRRYLYGQGILQDREASYIYLRQSALLENDAKDFEVLGDLFFYDGIQLSDKNIAHNKFLASTLYEVSASLGKTSNYAYVAKINLKKRSQLCFARYLLEKVLKEESNHSLTNYYLGKIYHKGIGIEPSPELSNQYYQSAYDRYFGRTQDSLCDNIAYFRVGQFYQFGLGRPLNLNLAAAYFLKAIRCSSTPHDYEYDILLSHYLKRAKEHLKEILLAKDLLKLHEGFRVQQNNLQTLIKLEKHENNESFIKGMEWLSALVNIKLEWQRKENIEVILTSQSTPQAIEILKLLSSLNPINMSWIHIPQNFEDSHLLQLSEFNPKFTYLNLSKSQITLPNILKFLRNNTHLTMLLPPHAVSKETKWLNLECRYNLAYYFDFILTDLSICLKLKSGDHYSWITAKQNLGQLKALLQVLWSDILLELDENEKRLTIKHSDYTLFLMTHDFLRSMAFAHHFDQPQFSLFNQVRTPSMFFLSKKILENKNNRMSHVNKIWHCIVNKEPYEHEEEMRMLSERKIAL
jgi:WD40 repeat protein/TPR repeat protein